MTRRSLSRVEARAGDSRAGVENSPAHAAPALPESKRPELSALTLCSLVPSPRSGSLGLAAPSATERKPRMSASEFRFGLIVSNGPARRRPAACSVSAPSGCGDRSPRDARPVTEAGGAARRWRHCACPSSVGGAAVDTGCRNHLVKRNCAAVRARRWLLGARWGRGLGG
jgi:hypothetical protein